jgi:hypothetical protein
MLTKELVLKTSEEQSVDPVTSIEYSRLVGGKVGNMPLTALHKVHKKRHHKMGGVHSGGAMSAGIVSHHAIHGGAHKPSKRAHKMCA